MGLTWKAVSSCDDRYSSPALRRSLSLLRPEGGIPAHTVNDYLTLRRQDSLHARPRLSLLREEGGSLLRHLEAGDQVGIVGYGDDQVAAASD